MQSSLLKKHGLIHSIGGSDYNFRAQTAGKTVSDDVEKLIQVMNIHPASIYSGQQVHGHHIAYANGKNGVNYLYGKQFSETDGLITDQPGVALLIKFADCTPIVLFDPVKQVQASVHSGWRGTVQQISVHAIEKMIKDFHCKREDIFAYVGPSIDQGHYEVGAEVYEAFGEYESRDNFFTPKGEKYLLSMQGANVNLLEKAGIQSDQIEVEKVTTYTNPRLHSARREGNAYQLNGIITMLSD